MQKLNLIKFAKIATMLATLAILFSVPAKALPPECRMKDAPKECFELLIKEVSTGHTQIPFKTGKPTEKGDMFAIENSEIVGGLVNQWLELEVSYQGGCREHDFIAYWDGAMIKTRPPGAALTIWHNSNEDPCRAIVSQTLLIDLKALDQSFGYLEIQADQGGAIRVDR